MTEIIIKTDYITLGQFLKLANIIVNGGEAKYFLLDNKVLINNEFDNRRGKKLYPETIIELFNKKYIIKKHN